MSKVKSKKHSTFIDMTAMSDVTVLLLTFFMLTATFLPKEPVQVTTPASVVEVKIPENNLLTILVKSDGRAYLNLDRPKIKEKVLRLVGENDLRGTEFSNSQIISFVNQAIIGVPFNELPAFLELPMLEQDAHLKTTGIPTDSTNNQLKRWIQHTVTAYGNEEFKIAIKADRSTPYPQVHNVISTLQDLNQNRFNLITTLRGMPEGY